MALAVTGCKSMNNKERHESHKNQHMHDPAKGVFFEDSSLEKDIQDQDLYQVYNSGAENDPEYAFYGLGKSFSRRIGEFRSGNLP